MFTDDEVLKFVNDVHSSELEQTHIRACLPL